MNWFTRFKTQFYAQNLPGVYKQKLTLKMCILFYILGLTNLVLGIISIFTFNKIFNQQFEYPETGNFTYKFTINKTIKGPIYIYLQISNFYQSFFKYARSFSSKQLEGQNTQSISSCYPLKYNNDKIIYPCGLIANSYVFDQYQLFYNNEEILVSKNDIAWKSAIDRIKNSDYSNNEVSPPLLWPQYNEVPMLNGDERFANWMLPASFPTFRKLFGKINGDLEPGEYELKIDAVTEFGDKSVFLTTGSWLGDTNYFLSISLIVSGVLIMISTVILWCLRHKYGY